MVSLKNRHMDRELMRALSVRSESSIRSIEAESRAILREVLFQTDDAPDLLSIFRKHFSPIHGINLELPSREPLPEPPELR